MAWYSILTNLCARIFVVLILFSVLCRTGIIRETINTLHEKVRSKVKLVLFFSFFGGLDLFCGTLLPTVVINNHSTYVISAGLILAISSKSSRLSFTSVTKKSPVE